MVMSSVLLISLDHFLSLSFFLSLSLLSSFRCRGLNRSSKMRDHLGWLLVSFDWFSLPFVGLSSSDHELFSSSFVWWWRRIFLLLFSMFVFFFFPGSLLERFLMVGVVAFF